MDSKRINARVALAVCAALAGAAVATAGVLPDPAQGGCTAFCLPGSRGPLVGRNYDFDTDVGLLLVNKRGSAKKGFDTDRPAAWTSQYGSVTFTQYSRDFAWGGMNETGLVVEALGILEKGAMEYPDADARPAIRLGQWVQYQLDTAATVADVVGSDRRVRIENRPRPVGTAHYLIGDAQGGCAVVEFVRGEMVARRGPDLAAPALTNTRYAELVRRLQKHDRKPQPLPTVGDMARRSVESQSVDRFLQAATRARAYREDSDGPAEDYARRILEDTRGENTRWRILYDVPARRVRWSTRTTPPEKFLDFASLDFSTRATVLCMNVPAPAAGNVRGSLVPWTHEMNTTFMRVAGEAAVAGSGRRVPGFLLKAADERMRLTVEFIRETCPPQTAPSSPAEAEGAAHPSDPRR